MSIIDFFKEHKIEILIGFIAFLIISFSFGTGYLMAHEVNPAPIIIEKCSES